MKKIFTFCVFLLFAIFAQAQIVYLKGVLQGSQEVPATSTGAGGVVILRYNQTTNFLELWGNYRDLSSTISASHIHASAAPGVNAGVLVTLNNTGGTSGGLTGTATFTEPQEVDLLAGLMYVNVHSANFGGGEIRAQVTRIPQDKAVFLNGRMQGAQETPPNNSPATGMTNVLLDTASHTLWITATYSGLTGTANNAHIHTGAPGIQGGVIVFVKYTAATAGSIDTSRVISTQIETDILAGNTYLNLHSSTFSGGELRAQLLQSANTRFFAGVLQGSQEVPAITSAGRGVVIVKYNTESNLFEFVGDYQNLSAAISASHVHGPAAIGASAGVLFDLTNTGGTMGTLTNTRTLTEPQEFDLLAGNWYANVHTSTNPGGEIRAQLLPLAVGETQYLTAALDVDEERAAFPAATIVSSGIGTAVAVLDKLTRNVYLTGSYSGLSAGISNSHIHSGAVAVSGPISVNLNFVATNTSGTVSGSATNVSTTLADAIISGNTYVNIHSSAYTSGEIRGQLGNLILPVKLSFFNGFRNQSKVSLVWASPQEVNVAYYEIEQQNLGNKTWSKKGTVAATGGSSLANYNFVDQPNIGQSTYAIYRLKIVDTDGKITYSSTIKINFQSAKAELMILANPVQTGVLRYTVTGLPTSQKTEVSILDMNGRVVAKTTASSLMTNEIPVQKLAAGMYKLVLRMNDTILQQNFIK